MKNKILKGLVTVSFAIAAVFTVSLTSVNAQSVYEEYSTDALVKNYLHIQ